MANLIQRIAGLLQKWKAHPLYLLTDGTDEGFITVDGDDGTRSLVVGQDPEEMQTWLSKHGAPEAIGPTADLGVHFFRDVLKASHQRDGVTHILFVATVRGGEIGTFQLTHEQMLSEIDDVIARGGV